MQKFTGETKRMSCGTLFLSAILLCAFFGVNVVQAVDETTVEALVPNEFKGGGVAQGWQGDDDEWNYTLPFAFNFFGTNYTNILIGSNGMICLDDTEDCTWYPTSISSSWYGPFIAPLAVDLISNGSDIYITESSNKVIIRWDMVEYGEVDSINFEVELFKNGNIKFNFGDQDMPPLTDDPTVGISKGDGILYTASAYNDTYVFDQVQTSAWGSFNPQVTTLVPANNDFNVAPDQDLTIRFDEDVFIGTGNIIVKDASDDSVIETLVITAGNVTGWGSDTLLINLQNDLQFSKTYYVEIDSTALKDSDDQDFDGITGSAAWRFTTQPDTDELTFTDTFTDQTYIDEDKSNGTWDATGDNYVLGLNDGWMNMARTEPGYENVYHHSGDIWDYSMTQDVQGHPVFSWTELQVEDPAWTDDVFFMNWSGTEWTRADDATPGPENVSNTYTIFEDSEDTDVITDSSGNPIVIYREDSWNSEVYLSLWNGSAWTQMDGVTLGRENVSNHGNTQDIFEPRLTIDGADNPIIVWRNRDLGDDIFVTRYSSGVWTHMDGVTLGAQNISNTPTYPSTEIDIIIDQTDQPIVVWRDRVGTMYQVVLSRYNGSGWTYTDGVTPGVENVSNTTGSATSPRIALDSSGAPAVVWDDFTGGNREILYTQFRGGQWIQIDGVTVGYNNVSNYSEYSYDPSIAIDSLDQPHIAWSNDNPDTNWDLDIFYSQWNGSAWTQAGGIDPGYTIVYEALLDSESPQIILDSDDDPIIAWRDNVNRTPNVFLARWTPANLSTTIIQSEKLNGMYEGVTSATLDATDDTPGASSIDYFLTNNGGAEWIPVNKGDELRFPLPGNDLRYRAVLKEGSTPVLHDVTVTYSASGTSGSGGEIIEAIAPCKCYVLGSAESSAPPGGVVTYSNTDQSSWSYTPVDDGSGSDCSVTYVRLTYTGSFSQVHEDFEVEFVGNFNHTETIPEGNGKVNLFANQIGTRTFPGEFPGHSHISVAIDSNDNIFITGNYDGTVDFDTTSGVDNHSSNGRDDIYISKHNADGTYAWTRTFGGAIADDHTWGISTDSADNVYVVGRFRGTVDFDNTGGTDIHTPSGTYASFITRYNSDGSYGWTYPIDVDGAAKGVVATSGGEIYVGGEFDGTADFDNSVGTDIHTSTAPYDDIYLTKLQTDGSYLWTRTFGSTGGMGGDDVGDLAIDSNNNVYLSGYFWGTADFDGTAGTDNHTVIARTDIFLTRYNADSSYGWTRTVGSTDYNEGNDVTVDLNDDVYFTGHFDENIDFDGTVGVDMHAGNGWRDDPFVTKYHADGSYGWTRTISSGPDDYGYGVTTDTSGNIYLIGEYGGTADFDLSGSSDYHTSVGENDVYITRINNDNSYGWTHTFGEALYKEKGTDIVVNSRGEIITVGVFLEVVNFNDTGGSDVHITTDVDTFITKYNTDGSYGAFDYDYATSGTYDALVTPHAAPLTWESLTMTQEIPSNTTFTTEVMDASCTNSFISASSDTSINLTGIPTTNGQLCLRTKFDTTDVAVTPKLDRWEASYTSAAPPSFGFYVDDDPTCTSPVDPTDPTDPTDPSSPTAPEITKIMDVGKHNLTLKVTVNNPDHYDKELTFKVKITNKDTGKEEYRMITATTDDEGKVSLKLDELKRNTNYSFRVTYSDTTYTSSVSNKEEAQTNPDIEDNESRPIDLEAEATSSTTIHLTWDDQAKGENGYLLERRREGDTEFTQVANLDKNTEEYTDTGLTPGVTYVYRVRAFHGDDYTGYSNEADDLTPTIPGEETTPNNADNSVITDTSTTEGSSQNTDTNDNSDNTNDQNDDNDPSQHRQTPVQPVTAVPSDTGDGDSGIGITEKIQELFIDPNRQNILLLIAIIGLISGFFHTVGATILALIFTATPLSQIARNITSYIGLLGKRKERPDWGVVFDAQTKRPVPGMRVNVNDLKDMLLDNMNADPQGQYGFLTKGGSYKVGINSSSYHVDYKRSHDALYGKIYDGQPIEVMPDVPVSVNLAIRINELDWHEFAKKHIGKLTSYFTLFRRFFFAFLFYGCYIFTVAITYFFPIPLNIILAIFYTIFLAMSIIKRRRPSYGLIARKESKEPVPFATISLFTTETMDVRRAFAVTDAVGRYLLFADDGEYYMSVKGRMISGEEVVYQGKATVQGGALRENVEV